MTHKISVLIRSHNESKWIKNCISSLLNQTIVPDEICVLDNKSNDGTIEIIKSLKKVKVFNYNKNYLPGKMLNYGISKTKGDYILVISAHCLPYDKFFLEKLINPLLNNKNICASYSRQIPFSFSDPSTIRDLMLLYGSEDKLQKNDPFFNNASSLIRKSAWKKNKFSNKTTNMEDRLWANEQQKKNNFIFYSSKSIVYHHHGFHQDNNKQRLINTSKAILKNQKNFSLKIGRMNIKLKDFLPVFFLKKTDNQKLKKFIKKIEKYKFSRILVFSEYKIKIKKKNYIFFLRNKFEINKELYLSDVIEIYKEKILMHIKSYEYLLIFDDNFEKLSKNYLNSTLKIINDEYPDSIFPVKPTRQPVFSKKNGKIIRIDNYNVLKKNFSPLYIAQRGDGTAIHVSNLFKKDKFGGKTNINMV